MKAPEEASTLMVRAQVSVIPADPGITNHLLLKEGLQLRRHSRVTDVSVEEAARGKGTRQEG